MHGDKIYRFCFVLFYCFWWLYTFLVVPGMGDPVYLVLCLIGCFSLLAAGFQFLPQDHTPSVICQSPKRRPKGYKEHEWRALVAKYNGRCLCCKKPGTTDNPITRDHVVPRVKGGSDTIDNLQPLCKSCNSRKKDKTIDYRPKWDRS